ncbi:cytochrome b561 and DOMON domain-containing protein At3g07570-like [Actinia tenebrosa]|uniref:Cytochrome b561 and DOMON domain-containing protein At3g07570-like n=1 Tax=Actinia tenebrosa TaxID=6105 RepID=A0A6P8HST6_ACTTE|nr:cytochrome b561 and DOMON domain-containing protein At3g07570-like [Actinia tenebrosa]
MLSQCATPRMYSAMAMLPSRDPSIRRAVLYGGREKTGSILYTTEAPSNEILIFDPDTNTWSRKKIEGPLPAKRFGHVMTTTPNGIIMFGGKDVKGKNLNDLWLLQGNVTDADQTSSLGECDSFSFNLIMLHGIFMFIGWGVLLQLGAFLARYYRHKDPWWFKMHRALQVVGLLFTIAGLACGIVSVPFGHLKFAHSIIGLVVMIVGLLQPLNALFRPHKFPDGSRTIKRIIWEWYHKLAGRAALILALINISLGVFLAVMPTVAWALWFGYLGLVCLTYIAMEVKLRMNKRKTGSSDMAMENQ